MSAGRPIGMRFAPVVAAVLFAVLVSRIGGAWTGFAEAGAVEAVRMRISAVSPAAPSEAATPAAPGEDPAPKSAAERLNMRLAARKAELDARERRLETRERTLEAAEQRIAAAIAEAEREVAALEAARVRQADAAAADYKALSSAYERMRPKDAARIFEVLDEEILASVAAGMRTQALSGVLAEMSPERAEILTNLLAARARAAPENPSAPQ